MEGPKDKIARHALPTFLPLLIAVLICTGAGMLQKCAAAETPKKPVAAATAKGVTIRFFEEQCPVSNGWLELQRAELLVRSEKREACWIYIHTDDGNNFVLVLDERLWMLRVPIDQLYQEPPPI